MTVDLSAGPLLLLPLQLELADAQSKTVTSEVHGGARWRTKRGIGCVLLEIGSDIERASTHIYCGEEAILFRSTLINMQCPTVFECKPAP